MTAAAGSGTTARAEPFDYRAFIGKYTGVGVTKYASREIVFAQGDPADAVYYIVCGTVKVTVISEHGKEAVLGILRNGDFFGEESLEGPARRNATVTAAGVSEIARFDRDIVARALRDDPAFAKMLLSHLLNQNDKLREDLIDQLFNSSEKRLARILLTLANAGHGEQSSLISIPVTQETLANMVGTTRSRISQFMTKFRRLGYIEYNGHIRVHNSLLNIILDDQAHADER